MEKLYIHENDSFKLVIERSTFSIFANIDLRNADTSEPDLKKYVDIYRRLLSELNFTPFSEEPGLMLFVHKDQNPSKFASLSKLKETLDERITKIEKECDLIKYT